MPGRSNVRPTDLCTTENVKITWLHIRFYHSHGSAGEQGHWWTQQSYIPTPVLHVVMLLSYEMIE